MKKSIITTITLLLGLSAAACGGTLQAKVENTPTPAPSPVTTAVPEATSSTAPSRPTASVVAPTATATIVAVAPTPTALTLGNLTVEEYPVVGKDLDMPNHFEFKQRILPAVLERRQLWRTDIFARQTAVTQEVLGRFGYRLVDRSSQYTRLFDLYRGETLVQAEIDILTPIALAASGNDFALVVGASGKYLLIRSAGSEPWDAMKHGHVAPIMVGDDLVTVEVTTRQDSVYGVLQDWSVCRGGQVLYTVRDQPVGPSGPIKRLQSWEGHWVLELEGRVLVDGQDLNAELGYDEIFAWQLLAGRPFYLYKKAGRIGVSYAGQTLAPRYEDVIHYKCCSPAAFNVAGNGTMVWGYALREGIWHYVELGIYR